MRRTSLVMLALALVAGACGSDDADRPVDPSRLRLQIVSGDRQTAPVAQPSGVAASPLPRDLSAAELPANLLPQPLVARIVVDGVQESRSIAGPSLAMLPSGVVVTYRVIQPTGVGSRHCGDSFVSSAAPDGDGYVTTYWERGTYAEAPCRMEMRLVVDGAPRVDTVFVADFEPGAPTTLGTFLYSVTEGAAIDLSTPVTGFHAGDKYGNRISDSLLVARWTPEWEITGPRASVHANCIGTSTVAQGSGWMVPKAPPAHESGYCLWINIDGRTAGITYIYPAPADTL